ncbi:hypothetical protein Pyn_01167 [Prunus yedoensis var. nudiflora]|uniref:Uncharacterized protein n=1 Tax=Prunus yedoensis var. nudiflora TaxID=2094558 RepID=A0A314ZQQ6_PRUYE|nr:hypothetical protein Pyn_01167 [Prunus yedoensis var. nudiflora]
MQDNTAAVEEEKPSSSAKKLLNHWLRFSSDVEINSISIIGGADGTSPSKMRAGIVLEGGMHSSAPDGDGGSRDYMRLIVILSDDSSKSDVAELDTAVFLSFFELYDQLRFILGDLPLERKHGRMTGSSAEKAMD